MATQGGSNSHLHVTDPARKAHSYRARFASVLPLLNGLIMRRVASWGLMIPLGTCSECWREGEMEAKPPH
jgi:hypothetical protein